MFPIIIPSLPHFRCESMYFDRPGFASFINQTQGKLLQLHPTEKGSELSPLLWGKGEAGQVQMVLLRLHRHSTQTLFGHVRLLNSSTP